jgi:hypothetical protein
MNVSANMFLTETAGEEKKEEKPSLFIRQNQFSFKNELETDESENSEDDKDLDEIDK